MLFTLIVHYFAFELWCWRRLLRVPWIASRSNQSILKEQSWIFIRRTAADAEAQILWPPDAENWLIGKDPDAGKNWRQEEKQTVEDEMVGWHHWLDGHEFEQAPGVGDGQGILASCSPWGCKESDTTEWLNRTELNWFWWAHFKWWLPGPGERHSEVVKGGRGERLRVDLHFWEAEKEFTCFLK